MSIEFNVYKVMKSYKRQFVLDIQYKTDAERLVIIGQSGSGKSMLLKTIAGLITPDRGRIVLQGRVLFDASQKINIPKYKRNLAYLFQSFALFPHLNVVQNIGFSLTHFFLNPRKHQVNDEIQYWLELFNLQEIKFQYPDEISGGQKQRVALARALILEPSAILLDEPFSALDTTLRAKMRIELAEIQEKLKIPMILITHDPEDANYFGDAIIKINSGNIIT